MEQLSGMFAEESFLPDNKVVYSRQMAEKPTLTQRMEKVESAVGISSRKSAAEWTRDHWLALSISVGTFVLIVIAYLAWWQPQWKAHEDEDLTNKIDHQIDSKLVAPLGQLSGQEKTLARIEGRLEEISDLLKLITQNEMKRIASLPPQDFNSNLPAVATVLAIAKVDHVESPSRDTIQNIKTKLNETRKDQLGFWGAAVALVNYTSSEAGAGLPDCLDMSPSVDLYPPAPGSTKPIIGASGYSNCKIELDDPRAADQYGISLAVANLEFRNCLIRYRGRSIIIKLQPPPRDHIVGRFVFINCAYEITPTVVSPPSNGRKLIETLLASPDLKSVSMKPETETA